MIKKYTSEVVFSEADRVVPYFHNRPLYVTAIINGVSFPRALMDGGASINIMPISTLYETGIDQEKVVPVPLVISGFDNARTQSIGYVNVSCY